MVKGTDCCCRYLQCCPLVAKLLKQKHASFHRLSDILRSLWPKKTPKIVMFGPGLESSTSHIVRKILDGQSQLFTVVSMFPGQFDGMKICWIFVIPCLFFFCLTFSLEYTSLSAARTITNTLHQLRINVHCIQKTYLLGLDCPLCHYISYAPIVDIIMCCNSRTLSQTNSILSKLV